MWEVAHTLRGGGAKRWWSPAQKRAAAVTARAAPATRALEPAALRHLSFLSLAALTSFLLSSPQVVWHLALVDPLHLALQSLRALTLALPAVSLAFLQAALASAPFLAAAKAQVARARAMTDFM